MVRKKVQWCGRHPVVRASGANGGNVKSRNGRQNVNVLNQNGGRHPGGNPGSSEGVQGKTQRRVKRETPRGEATRHPRERTRGGAGR